jgi:hypothetical protein
MNKKYTYLIVGVVVLALAYWAYTAYESSAQLAAEQAGVAGVKFNNPTVTGSTSGISISNLLPFAALI